MFRRAVVPMLLAAVATMVAHAQDLRYNLFPQMAVGSGWSDDFFVTNQGLIKVWGLNLSFYDDSGAPLVVQTDQPSSGSSFDFDLAEGETFLLRVTSASAVKAGYAILRCGKWDAVTATMVARYQDGSGKTVSQLGLPYQFPAANYLVAAEVRDPALPTGVNTGMALARAPLGSAAPSKETFLIHTIGRDGALKGTKLLTLNAGEHLSLFLTDPRLFPNLTNFQGTVLVSGSVPFGFLALRLEGLALGTVAINEGPLLAPFKLSAAPLPETEPNDSRSEAQQISPPVVYSGVIDTPDDIDFFKFQGTKGTVLTVMVDTQPRGSSDLDSEVTLLNSKGDVVAQNDQNGVYSQDDSFLHLVLPADDTYYVRIWDYWGDYGGPKFTYRLHVTLQVP